MTTDLRDLDRHADCTIPNCWCIAPRAAFKTLALTYSYEPRPVIEEDRRGWQLQICPKGFKCCGWVTVIRIMFGTNRGREWSEEFYILWPQSSGVGSAHHADELISAIARARELGPSISRDP